MAKHQRGLSQGQEHTTAQVVRDTRTLGMRVTDFLKHPRKVALLFSVFALLTYILSAFAELIFLLAIGCMLYSLSRRKTLPFRVPQSAHQTDFSDINPATKKPREGRGIYFFGNSNEDNEELWFNNDDMRTHVLIFGSTGSGKTEGLISLAYNAMLQASGFIYVDGKGDNSLYAKVFSMVRGMGRDDDILLINFMTGARDIIGPQAKRISNTLNPFSRGSSSMLAQLVVSLMDSSSSSSDGDMWKGRAIGFVEAIMKVLVAMRDAGNILLDANAIRNYFLLPRIEAMVVDKLFIRDGQESVSLEGLPPTIMEPIANYLFNLPGYNKERKGKQVSQVLEQHGFITMQLTRAFTSLADTYGHIMRTKLAEVDLTDVVLNRRILCVLLPALEKAPAELANLGKVIIATLRAMMAAGLGDSVEGDYADLVASKPTNAKTPFLCILDEYGYYAVEGFAVVPAQARSLGFSVVFAGQDLPAFQKASKEEAASIGANTNIKICMKLEDPTETWEFFMKGAGESYVTQVESFQVDQGSVFGVYADSKSARVEKRARIDLLDLKEQDPGEFHIFFRSKIVRGRVFFANPKNVKRMRLNHMLKVDSISDVDAQKLIESFGKFDGLLRDGGKLLSDAQLDESEQIFTELGKRPELAPIDRAYVSMQSCYGKADAGALPDFADEFFGSHEEKAQDLDYLNVFVPMQINEHLRGCMVNGDRDEYQRPMLERAYTAEQIEYVERLSGKSAQKSNEVAKELIYDMEKGTHYPPEYRPDIKGDVLAEQIDEVVAKVSLKKQEAEAHRERDQ